MNYKNILLLALVFATVIILSNTAYAAKLDNWEVDISVNDDKGANWTIKMDYAENVSRSSYFVLANVDNIEVFADDLPIECSVSREFGTTIICNNIDTKNVLYKFHTANLVDSVQNLFVFKHRFSITELTNRFYLVVKLPLGTAIVEKSKLEGTGLKRFEPAWGREGSDGRRIYIEWLANEPHLGETFDASVIYENIFLLPEQPIMIYIAIAAVILLILIALYFIKFRHKVEDMLPVLTENERRVMEIIIKEKMVDQRRIVKETDFSKAKVSRIIHDLIKRGLIEKTQTGRANIIKLKRVKNIEIPKGKEK
jgi:uncharacterized membrane protein